jgi:hypothetical protein
MQFRKAVKKNNGCSCYKISQILNKKPNFSGVILLSINGETIVQEVMGESIISKYGTCN